MKRLNVVIPQAMGLGPNHLSHFCACLDQKLVGVEGATPIPGLLA